MHFNIGFLLVFVFVSACGLDLPPKSGVYQVTSDVPDSKTQSGTLQLPDTSNLLSLFDVQGAKDFGFPTETFSSALGGVVESISGDRACRTQIFAKNSKNFIFLCQEAGKNIGSITFKMQ
jgi:hypothetical protein